MENALNLPRRFPDTISQDTSDGASRLPVLREIGRALAEAPHLKLGLARSLELLTTARGLKRAFVLLLDAETAELRFEAGCGIDPDAARAFEWRKGEGVVGGVVESGRPAVVTRAASRLCRAASPPRPAHPR